ncbi:thrombospondin type 3 repeat-containing protein [Winogradskyella sp. A2]|uniref:thrombospondin type 3 repeat-containing protein n=1 Tax=Winogradskyella sp. A2 TaxID=3366944 RepID=UPI00398C3C21
MKTKLHFVLSLSMFLCVFSVFAQQSYWEETKRTDLINDGNPQLNQKFYQTFRLNIDELKNQLASAPLRSAISRQSTTTIYLPNADGKLEQFRVVEAPVLSEELYQLYPKIKTYLGFSNENPGTRARFSITPLGLQTMISSPGVPNSFTVPHSRSNNSDYINYTREVRKENIKDFDCITRDEFFPIDTSNLTNRDANDQTLRTFRIAISTTAEYTGFWDDGNAGNGDASQDALAQVVSTLNRSNEVFEVDMAVTFTLVTGTEVIFTDTATDPYNGNFNSEVQNTLTNIVGEANYDVGHLFHFGGNNGSAGCIGCVCVDAAKGSGFSSHSFLDNDGGPYMSDFFDIDYVPHEIGHQMGANHTWSFSSEGTGVNVEPGSGTTIMGYAGITGPNDIQDHSDPYFHYFSILQILANLQSRTCWVGTAISNNPPVANAGNNFTIPIGTAFVLKGDATDADVGDILTYTWEQIDNGVTTSGNFGPNKLSGAVWRSRPPSITPDRFMPIIERVISGQLTEQFPVETVGNTSWETVSNVSRTLNFALTVRDRSEANGIGQTPQSDFDTMTVTVDNSAGPFTITSQTTNESWDVDSDQTITWDIAGTDSGAVNTSNVNILLSIDGGFTYPISLVSNTANDGSQVITVPSLGAEVTNARIKVEASNNIFYAINSTDFTIRILDDIDGDTIPNSIDNCPEIANVDQADLDNDGIGDVCDDDIDGDSVLNDVDNCVDVANTSQADIDNDGIGDECDDDSDGDGILNNVDNCPLTPNVNQEDNDMDGIGDICDDDDDNDSVFDTEDNCPLDFNPDQLDVNNNGIGDACDSMIVYDVLTPNGDGINDTWTILNADRYPNAIIKVFNRWGKEVFSTIGYNNDWNGTYSGNTLPTGSYYYQVDQNGDGTVMLTGWIYLTF